MRIVKGFKEATIWKFPLTVVDDQIIIEMPKGAQVLSIQMQRDIPTIWALVNPQAPKEQRKFRLAGTGHLIKEAGEFLYHGTFQMTGNLVFHLFEHANTN